MTQQDIQRVKGLGFLRDKTTEDCFNARVITRNGKITSEEAIHIAEAARRYGKGEVAMTTRMTIEIQGVPYANIEPLRAFLKEGGLETGGTGPRVRPVVSCKGTTCVFGLIDTFGLAREIHDRFYEGYHEVKLPHKFKIGVGGCPNNCAKPDLNDIGIVGQRIIKVNLDKCRGCKGCKVAEACPIHAAEVRDGKVVIDESCNRCGRCLSKCPFGAFEEKTDGYRIYVGGRWGKKCARGTPIGKIFLERGEVLDFIEKSILFFKERGENGERFADTIARIGFDAVEAELLDHAILARKDEILKA